MRKTIDRTEKLKKRMNRLKELLLKERQVHPVVRGVLESILLVWALLASLIIWVNARDNMDEFDRYLESSSDYYDLNSSVEDLLEDYNSLENRVESLSANAVSSDLVQDSLEDKISSSRDSWMHILNWPASCEKDFIDSSSSASDESGISFFEIDENTMLIRVACSTSGFIDQTYMLYIVRNGGNYFTRYSVSLDQPRNIDNQWVWITSSEIEGFISYDEHTYTLEVQSGYLEGCGVRTSYRFNSNTLSFLRVKTVANLDCDDPIPASQWEEVEM